MCTSDAISHTVSHTISDIFSNTNAYTVSDTVTDGYSYTVSDTGTNSDSDDVPSRIAYTFSYSGRGVFCRGSLVSG